MYVTSGRGGAGGAGAAGGCPARYLGTVDKPALYITLQEGRHLPIREECASGHQGAVPAACALNACGSPSKRSTAPYAVHAQTPQRVQGLTLKQHIEHTLGTGSVEDAVRLPPGEDFNEWLAVNTVFFYNALNVLYQVGAGRQVEAGAGPGRMEAYW